MRLNQLYQYLGELITAGLDPETVVCIHGDVDMEVMEVCDVDLLTGPYRADPAPKMPAFLPRNGTVLLLKTCLDYDSLSESHQREDLTAECPEKSWPNGWGN